MAEAIELILPCNLTTVGRGTVAFTVEVVDNAYRDWSRTCRVEGVEGGRAFAFQPGGRAVVSIPGDFVGRSLLVVRLCDPRTGRGLVGDCPLEIRRYGDVNVRIDAGGHAVGEEGVIYQPIELGDADSGALRVVEGEVRLPVALEDEPLAGSWPLADLAGRESLIRLPPGADELARGLSFHVGPAVVAGRCYASQLRPEARRRLDDAGESKVHWVTRWDDAGISQLSARLSFRTAGDAARLRLENLGDYSASRQVLELRGGTRPCDGLPPGADREITVDRGEVLELAVGGDGRRFELVRFGLDEVAVGNVLCPLFRTERTVFPFPPDAGDAGRVRFLAVWLPLKVEDLRDLVELAGSPLAIFLPEADLRLVVAFDGERRRLIVGSNEDLSAGLD